jgi:hypothetical protein
VKQNPTTGIAEICSRGAKRCDFQKAQETARLLHNKKTLLLTDYTATFLKRRLRLQNDLTKKPRLI